MLLSLAPPEHVVKRYGRLVVGSGDGLFAVRPPGARIAVSSSMWSRVAAVAHVVCMSSIAPYTHRARPMSSWRPDDGCAPLALPVLWIGRQPTDPATASSRSSPTISCPEVAPCSKGSRTWPAALATAASNIRETFGQEPPTPTRWDGPSTSFGSFPATTPTGFATSGGAGSRQSTTHLRNRAPTTHGSSAWSGSSTISARASCSRVTQHAGGAVARRPGPCTCHTWQSDGPLIADVTPDGVFLSVRPGRGGADRVDTFASLWRLCVALEERAGSSHSRCSTTCPSTPRSISMRLGCDTETGCESRLCGADDVHVRSTCCAGNPPEDRAARVRSTAPHVVDPRRAVPTLEHSICPGACRPRVPWPVVRALLRRRAARSRVRLRRQLELRGRDETERGGAPDYGVIWNDRLWMIEIKTEAGSHRHDQVPGYFTLAAHHFPQARLDITYLTGPMTYEYEPIHAGERYSHVTWSAIVDGIRELWGGSNNPSQQAVVDHLCRLTEDLVHPAPGWRTRLDTNRSSRFRQSIGWSVRCGLPTRPQPMVRSAHSKSNAATSTTCSSSAPRFAPSSRMLRLDHLDARSCPGCGDGRARDSP